MTREILYVNTPTYIGGAEVSLLTLMRGLDRQYYTPILVTSDKSQLADAAQSHGIETQTQEFSWFRKRYPWRYPASIIHMASLIARHRVALVHSNCDRSLPYIRYATKLARVPYVSHVRDLVRAWFLPPYLAALKQARRVIANSQSVAQACIDAGLSPRQVVTVYNPVALEEFQMVSAEEVAGIRYQFGIAPNALVVGIVGQIQSIKGHQEFIEAGLRLGATLADVHFLIVGAASPGELNQQYLAGLRKSVAAAGQAEKFHFAGFRHDIPAIMGAIDILAVPSWTESFGRVAVEGMAAGCAVIATRAGGLPEIVSDRENGLLIEPKDAQSLYDALTNLIADPALRQRYADNGRRSAQRFGVAQHVRQMQALYDEVLSTASKPKTRSQGCE